MDSSKKRNFTISILITIALTILIPGSITERFSWGMARYEYGFPLKYISFYQFNATSQWILSGFFKGRQGFSFDPVIFLINALIVYFIIDSLRSKENLKDRWRLDQELVKYLALLFLGLLLSYKLPHNSYSIIQYIIRPIPISNGMLYLSGLPILFIVGYSIYRIVNLPRFYNKSKFLIFLVIVVVIMPLMKNTINFTRTVYHTIAQSNLSALDCNFENSKINLTSREESYVTATVSLELKDYGTRNNQFKVRVHVPEEWKRFFKIDYIELENIYYSQGYKDVVSIQEEVQLEIADDYTYLDVVSSRWHYETFYYELYNDVERVMIVNHGR